MGSEETSSQPAASAPLCGPGSLNPNSEYCYGGISASLGPVNPDAEVGC